MNRLQKYCTTKRLAAPWLALLCLLYLPIMGQRIAPYFKKGDRVCFVGNSITHNGEFHHNILQYYVTRFPQIPVRFYNAGLKGDVTGGILKRIDGDVMIHKPTHVVIMIGMNDVQRDLYGSSPTKDTDTLARRKAALELYRQNLDSIVQLFLKKGVRVMLQRPSAYDQTSTIKHPNNLGANDALLECGRMMQQLAQRYKLHIIDYGTLMTDIAHTMQKKNPAATLSINDRVHPSSTGHFIMAYQFLKTAKAPATVSNISIDIHQLKANRTTTHGGINGARYQKDTLTFEILEKALPYPLSDQQQQANALVPFTQELNRQTLQVLHLKKGNYRLLIDSTTIATFSSEALQAGINLAIYNNTPQYQQALQVKKVLERLWENEATQRAVAFVDYMHLPPLAERTDMGIVKKYLDSLYAQRFKGQPYYSNAFEKYVTYKTQTLKLLQQADSLRDLAYQKAQPVVHRFTLQKIKEPTVAALIEASQSAAAPLLFDVNPSYLVNATNQSNVAEEFYPRRGLPHFIAKLKQPTPSLTVGFLGGSITKAEDQYRNQTLALIQSLYPNAKLKGINAGVSGTGTELGACRVQEQVIQYRPDLVFVEFAVNGGSNQALEGIVRQIKKRHPQTDICFLYTIAGDQYLQYARNEVPPKIRAFEKVADYYQIPSIHLGRYPAMLAMQDKLIWKSADAVQDKIVFSKDGTHPAKAGGDLYAQAIARALTVLTKEGLHQISTMPPALYADNWEDGGMYAPAAIGTFTKDWDTIHPQGHPYLNGFAPWFTTIYKATAPKASFGFKFSGTAVGFFDIGGPEVGQVLVEIDGHCAALNRKAGNAANKLPNETGLACLNNRFNANCNNRYRGQFEIFDVPDGIHSVTITLSHLQADKSAILQGQDLTDIQTNPDRYNQQVFYLGKILIKGAAIVQ